MLKLLRQPGHGLMTFPEAMSSMSHMISSLPPPLADLAKTKSWFGLQITTQVPSLLHMTPLENLFPAFLTYLSEERHGQIYIAHHNLTPF